MISAQLRPSQIRKGNTQMAGRFAGTLANPLATIIRELGTVVMATSSEQFVQRCGEQFFNANIGGHVRHCLDHVRALTDGHESGEVDYDHRERGTDIETNVDSARLEIARLALCIERLAGIESAQAISVTVKPTRDGEAVAVESTLGRELSFVLSHTIHHNAIVRSMAFAIGVQVPQTFGYAPSTLAHMDSHECAR